MKTTGIFDASAIAVLGLFVIPTVVWQDELAVDASRSLETSADVVVPGSADEADADVAGEVLERADALATDEVNDRIKAELDATLKRARHDAEVARQANIALKAALAELKAKEQVEASQYQQALAAQAQARAAAKAVADTATAQSRELARDEILKAVQAGFAARQELQALEIQRLKERVQALEIRLKQREQLREQIIIKRVEDMLKGTVEYQDDLFRTGEHRQGSTPDDSADRSDLRLPDAAEPSKADRYSRAPSVSTTNIARAPASADNFRSRTPTEFYDALRGAWQATREIEDAESSSNPSSKVIRENAQKRYELLNAEYVAQLRILESQLAAASANLEAVAAELQQMERLKQKGYVPASTVTESEARLVDAKAKHDQATALYKMYQMVWDTRDAAESPRQERDDRANDIEGAAPAGDSR